MTSTATFSLRPLPILIALTACLGSAPAQAQVYSGTFIGAIDVVSPTGGNYAVGDILTAQFTYDLSLASDSYNSNPNFGEYDGVVTSASVSIGADVWTLDNTEPANNNITVQTVALGSSYAFNFDLPGPSNDGRSPLFFHIAVSPNFDVNSDSPPSVEFNATNAPHPGGVFFFRDSVLGTQTFTMIAGTDNSLTTTLISSVPEPASYALLLAGLGIVGTIAGRRASRP